MRMLIFNTIKLLKFPEELYVFEGILFLIPFDQVLMAKICKKCITNEKFWG